MNGIHVCRSAGGRAGQRGLSLVTTLLFMVAALMLGVSVLSVNVMQERTIGNTKDRDLALQAAEAALRDAERDIDKNWRESWGGADAGFTSTCANGLCARAPGSSVAVEAGLAWADDGKVRKYGQFSGAAKFAGVAATDAAQPRYVIEYVGEVPPPAGTETATTGRQPAPVGRGYRITARALGARPETEVILQSVYTVR